MKYLIRIHIAALAMFTLLRVALFVLTPYDLPAEVAGDWTTVAEAFVRGLWFDNVIACYISILPLVVTWIATLLRRNGKWLQRFCAAWFIALYAVAFSVCAANIPYFAYFFKIINSSIWNWAEYAGTTAGMIFGEKAYYLPIALGLAAIAAWAYLVVCLTRNAMRHEPDNKNGKQNPPFSMLNPPFLKTFILGAILVGLCLFGIRGRMGYNPIKVSQAYYCQDPFLNQIGVNPVFNLLTSTLDDRRKENRPLTLMDSQEAVAQARQLLGRNGIEGLSPIARTIHADSTGKRRNVVFIFMESMSAKLMQAYGSTKTLTPFLDSLYHESMTFDNIWSAGIHTNHGMYSTLYSFPTIMKRNAMKGSVIPQYSGLPTVLKDNGYRNLFFMTHESQYDNMNAFFRTNGFHEIYAEENYPPEKIANHFGVQDDFLYEYALPIFDERAQTGQPFFGVLLSISNHPPYVIPPYFQPKSEKPEDQIVEYADWSIRRFMTEAMKRPWAEQTLFVFMGDHGKLVGTPECEMPESYNHIPLMVYGKGVANQHIAHFGGQIDVAPTLLGMLGISYTQVGFGIDLMKEQRPCIFYTADNLIAARDSSRLYIHSPETGQEFHYSIGEGKQRPTSPDASFEALKHYVFTMLQATEQLVKEGKTVDK